MSTVLRLHVYGGFAVMAWLLVQVFASAVSCIFESFKPQMADESPTHNGPFSWSSASSLGCFITASCVACLGIWSPGEESWPITLKLVWTGVSMGLIGFVLLADFARKHKHLEGSGHDDAMGSCHDV